MEVLTGYIGELREPLLWDQGSQVSMRVARGSTSLLSTHGGESTLLEIRKGEGAQMKWCREPQCSSRVSPVFRGTFWVASRVPSAVSNFKTERGTSPEMLYGKELHLAMTGEPRGFSQVVAGFSSNDREFWIPLVLAQGSPIFHSS